MTVTITTCDLCGANITNAKPVLVEFLDGEHPYNGSSMYKTAELCHSCICHPTLELKSHSEFDVVENFFKKGLHLST